MWAGFVGHEIRRRDSDVIVGLEEIRHRAVDGTEGYDEMTWWPLRYLEGPYRTINGERLEFVTTAAS